MCILLEFKTREMRTVNSSHKQENLGCKIIIFPGIRYSSELNVVKNDKQMSKQRKIAGPKRPVRIKKRGG
jgi:hypothetical protein